MSAPEVRTPLANRSPLAVEGAISMAEAPQGGLLIVRGQADTIAAASDKVLGIALPTSAGLVGESDRGSILWLGPDEWLIATDLSAVEETRDDFERYLAGQRHQVVEVSDFYTSIAVEGPAVRDMLSKLVLVDLHPSAFAPDTAIATVLAKAHVWLWARGDDRFSVVVRRSHADYLWCLLAEAGREWDLPAQSPIGRVALHLPQE